MHGPGDVRFFDRLAPLYDAVMPAARRSALAAGLARAERPLQRVADLGGGTGRATVHLPGEPVVVDPAGGMLRRARGRGLACVRGDAGRLPFRADSLDAVTVVDALHHMPDRAAVLAEAARVLSPGGVLVIREFDPGHPLGRLLVAGERLLGFDSAFTGPDDLAAVVAGLGLDASVVDRGFGYTVAAVAPGAGD